MLSVVATASTSQAGMAMFSQSVKVDHAADTATFTIDFPNTPDFQMLNSMGKQVDSFSVEVAANPSGPNPLSLSNLTSVVRGGEIHIAGTLPIRNAQPPVSDPAAGGWGSIRGAAPFTLKGNELKFTANLNTLGAPSGNFAYRVFTEHGGTITGSAQSSSVPLPTALTAGLMMLGIGMVVSVAKSRRKC
jgi:hypothetical protein